MRVWSQARDRGAWVHSFLLDSMNPETVVRSLRRLGRKSDATSFFGIDHPEIAFAADELANQGKLVLTLISDITGSRRHAFIGIDNLAAGRTAAYLLAAAAPASGGKLAVIAATSQYQFHVERELEFQELIQCDPRNWISQAPLKVRTIR